ncbi:hypothetical protein NT6N_23930 [Oceaniferula spumae]|uniref:Uncharacterized protein n=1 Tax=Oceaniferula spumae TaxID=2979115 RepID=A0AAT9FN21_9BACT
MLAELCDRGIMILILFLSNVELNRRRVRVTGWAWFNVSKVSWLWTVNGRMKRLVSPNYSDA